MRVSRPGRLVALCFLLAGALPGAIGAAAAQALNPGKGSTLQVVDELKYDRKIKQTLPPNAPGRTAPAPDPNGPCVQAAKAFSPLQKAHDEEPDEDKRAAMRDAAFLAAAMAYRQACFAAWSAAEPALAAAGVDALVGVLTFNGSPFCMGFKVEPQAILTARHCFFDKEKNVPLRSADNLGAVSFLAGANSAMSYKALTLRSYAPALTAIADASVHIPHAEDRIVVQLDRPFADGRTLTLDTPADEPLHVAGIFTYDGRPALDDLLWAKSSRVCKAAAPRNGCFQHGCQTSPGFSGAPLFGLRNGRPVIVGMHISAASDDGACRLASTTDYEGNLAIPVAPFSSAHYPNP